MRMMLSGREAGGDEAPEREALPGRIAGARQSRNSRCRVEGIHPTDKRRSEASFWAIAVIRHGAIDHSACLTMFKESDAGQAKRRLARIVARQHSGMLNSSKRAGDVKGALRCMTLESSHYCAS